MVVQGTTLRYPLTNRRLSGWNQQSSAPAVTSGAAGNGNIQHGGQESLDVHIENGGGSDKIAADARLCDLLSEQCSRAERSLADIEHLERVQTVSASARRRS